MTTFSRLKLLQRYLQPGLLNNVSPEIQLYSRCYAISSRINDDCLLKLFDKRQENRDHRKEANLLNQHRQLSQVFTAANFFVDDNSRETKASWLQRPKKTMKQSLQQFNDENVYIHKHVQSKLVDFSHLGSMIDKLPVKLLLDELYIFAGTEHEDDEVYKDARSSHFKKFKSTIDDMDLKELAILMTYIKDNEKSEVRVIKKMVDVELKSRLRNYNRRIPPNDLNLYLYLADVFFQAHAITTFVTELIGQYAKRADLSMNDQQLLYMLFLINLDRNQQGLLDSYEDRILKILDKPSLGDLVTICMGFFKSRSYVHNPTILKKMLDRTLMLLPSIDYTQPGYCAIIKCVRYSRVSELREDVLKLINKVTQDASCSRVLDSIYNLTQTAKLMETYRIYDSKLLDRLRDSAFKKVDEFRIKDIQYVLTTLSNSRYRNLKLDNSFVEDLDALCQTIITESRPDARYQHNHLCPFLRAFMEFEYHNDDFICYLNKTLEDDEKVKEMKRIALDFEKTVLLAYAATRLESKGAELQVKESLLADCNASIKRFGSTGSVRNDSSIGHLSYLLHPDNRTKDDKYFYTAKMRSIAESLLSVDGLNSPELHYNFQFTMAHQNYADLVISLNQPAPGSYDSSTLMPRQTIMPNQKHCLVYAVQNNDFMDGLDRLSGFKELIMRLLAKLGYDLVVVNLDKPDLVQLSSSIRSVLQGRDARSANVGLADAECDRVSS